MVVPCFQVGVEVAGRTEVERDPYPQANPSFPGPGRQGYAHIRNAGGGSRIVG